MSGLSEEERRVFDYLVNAIAERRLAPGVRLVEADLANTFEVSRGKVRKVLLALGETHGVRHEPNRGAHVARPSLDEAHGTIASRLLIEPRVAHDLALMPARQRAASCKQLLKHVMLEQQAFTRHARGEEIRLSGQFHVLMCQSLGNRVLAEIVERLVLLSSLALATHVPTVSDRCGPEDHLNIVHAIRDGNSAVASDAMEHHLRHIEEALRSVTETEDILKLRHKA